MLRNNNIEKLQEFLAENIDSTDIGIIDADTDLIEEGILDSLLMVMLMAYCEEEFGIEMDPDELTEDNFRSIKNISSFLSTCLTNQEA